MYTTGSFSVSQNTPYTSPDIPAGTTCTVTETQPTGSLADSSWSWEPTDAPRRGLRHHRRGQRADRDGAEHLRPGDGHAETEQARAAASWCAAGGLHRWGPHLPGCLHLPDRSPSAASGTAEVANGGTSTVTGLPATAVPALSETLTRQAGDFADPSLTWDGNSFSSPSVTIVANAERSSTVTNFFIRQTASLTLGKQIDGAGYTGGSAENFTVHWDCGTASGTVTLARNATKTVTVPASTGCTVTEVDPAGNLDPAHDWGPPTYVGLTSGLVTVPPGGSATVTVTNHTVEVFGTVTVTKQITGATEGVLARATFPITVACDRPAQGTTGSYSETFDLMANETVSTPPLPVGTGCTVTEGTLPALGLVDDSYAWGRIPQHRTSPSAPATRPLP